MRLVKIAKTPTKNMLQVDIPEGSGVWGFCSAEVKAYAQQNLKEGDEIELTYAHENGQLNISFIKKAGTSNNQNNQSQNAQQQTGFKCESCGTPLRDGKYKKCYACNQNKSTSPASNFNCKECGKPLRDGKYDRCFDCNKKNPKQTKSTSTSDSYDKQNANKATAVALTAMIGQVNPNNVIALINDLYDAFMKNFSK